MAYTIKTLKNDESCKTILGTLLNATNNPISCANYGGGDHCDNVKRTDSKCSL